MRHAVISNYLLKSASCLNHMRFIMKKIVQSSFNFLASLNVTIFTISAIVLLTLLQLAGTKYQTAYNWQWLKTLASIDLFHSRFFIAFSLLFALNLLTCCIKQLQKTVRILKDTPKPLDNILINSLPAIERFRLNDFDESPQNLSKAISDHFRKPVTVRDSSQELCFYAEKGRYTHLAFYLAHLSILTLVIGMMLSTQGYHYSLDIAKNQIIDPLVVVDGKKNRVALDFGLSCNDFRTSAQKTTGHGGSKKEEEYKSTLSILKNGKKIKTRVVDYGTSLQHEGFDIYQDRFDKKIRYARIKTITKDGKDHIFEVKKNERFKLPGSVTTLRPIRLKSDTLQLKSSHSPAKLWISNNPASFSGAELNDYQFSLIEYFYKETTSLKIIRDPGKGIVWGSVLSMLAGFGIMFFCSHKKIWAIVQKKDNGCAITLGGTSTKNLQSLKETIRNISNEIKEERQS